MPTSRLAGWSGIVFVILSLVIVVVVPPLPQLNSQEDVIIHYYQLHGERFLFANYLALLASVPSFVFFSQMVSLIKNSDNGGWLWIAVLTTMILAHAIGTVDLVFFQVAAFEGSQGNLSSIKIFSDLAMIGFGFFFLIQSALIGYANWAMHKFKLCTPLQIKLGWLAALTSFLPSLGTIAPEGIFSVGTPLTGIGFFIFFLWISVLSTAWIRIQRA